MRQSFYIAFVVALQLLATFAMQLLVVRLAGVNTSTDAYIAAQAVPSVLSAILMSALQSVWLPRLAVITDEPEQWQKEQAKAQGQSFIMAVGAFGVLWGTHLLWQPLLFPGFSAQQLQEVSLFCTPLFLAAAFNTQSALLTVALRAKGKFIAAESIATFGSIFALISVAYTLPEWGLMSVTWITAIRAVLVYGLQLWLAKWPGIDVKEGFKCRETWQLMRPLLFGASIYKTSPLVDRFFLSQVPAGGMTAFSLAQTAMSAVATILEKSISMPITPTLTRLAVMNEKKSLLILYKRTILKFMTIISLFIMLVIISQNIIIINLINYLKINSETAQLILMLFLTLTLYGCIAGLGGLTNSIFYALNDTKTVAIIATAGFLLSIIVRFIGFYYYGLIGLAASISIYYLLNFIILNKILNKRIENV